MNREEPYSARHILAVITAPVWFPLLIAVWLTGMVLGFIFMILCALSGGFMVVAGSLLELVRAKELGVGLRRIGTDTIRFGVETFKELGY